MNGWQPRTIEDNLLAEYWKEAGGRIYTEVPIGCSIGHKNWPEGSKIRRIDGIRIKCKDIHEEIVTFGNNNKEFLSIITDTKVDLIEVKQKLNRPVIGQIVAGLDMFKVEYQPKEIRGVIVCGEGDPHWNGFVNKET